VFRIALTTIRGCTSPFNITLTSSLAKPSCGGSGGEARDGDGREFNAQREQVKHVEKTKSEFRVRQKAGTQEKESAGRHPGSRSQKAQGKKAVET
jgi:hypothetical protein